MDLSEPEQLRPWLASESCFHLITSFTTAQVDGMTTPPAGSPASVAMTASGSTLHFSFALPQGNDGIQGPPGEVTALQFQAAIASTSGNSNSISSVDMAFGDPEVAVLRQRLNDLIIALRR